LRIEANKLVGRMLFGLSLTLDLSEHVKREGNGKQFLSLIIVNL
jgi:hypothetical protein